MTLRILRLWLGGLLLGGALQAAPGDLRFSRALSGADFTAAGMGKLSTDQLASLDALVRREVGRTLAGAPGAGLFSARPFSGRLVPAERQAAGLDRLTAPELARLDRCVAALGPPDAALVTGPLGSPEAPVEIEIARRAPEIHGSVMLELGAGSGGYSERSAGFELNYFDPDRGFGVAVGMTESQVKSRYPLLNYNGGSGLDGSSVSLSATQFWHPASP
jgi:hypothetical protein